uniref:Uncharacterized protein n=1 Tax=Arundo donax TaxID=35708 RepID=A0A0A9FIK8_ARUDO
MIMLVKDYLVGRLLYTHPETVDLFRRTIL